LEKQTRCQENDLALGDRVDRARLDAGAIGGFLRQVRSSGAAEACPDGIVAEGVTTQTLEKAHAACGGVPLIVALPTVFFEEDIEGLRRLVQECERRGVTVEVNSWGGWQLAREAGVRMEGGPGLPVLNALAARVMTDAGMACVTLSIEADRQQLEDAAGQCPAPCSMIVFGRPALMVTRVKLDRERFLHKTLTDRRGAKLVPRLERGLWVFRPVEPFDLRRARNERVRVHHLVADMVASPDPAGEWLRGPAFGMKPLRFNYSRTLA
jgi:hypothetical protein